MARLNLSVLPIDRLPLILLPSAIAPLFFFSPSSNLRSIIYILKGKVKVFDDELSRFVFHERKQVGIVQLFGRAAFLAPRTVVLLHHHWDIVIPCLVTAEFLGNRRLASSKCFGNRREIFP